MNSKLSLLIVLIVFIPFLSCNQKEKTQDVNIVFLHHSTGGVIWKGGNEPSLIHKGIRRISHRLASIIGSKAQLPSLLNAYNKEHFKNYRIKEMLFPKASPYGWKNYPYDYYNIWVKNAGEKPFIEEPTLEMLTKDYQVVIFKHCYPVSNVQEDENVADINSEKRTLSNYKLQYMALREKLHTFPDTKFILFTGAVQVKTKITEEEAIRTSEFFEWVRNEWDLPGDNIHLWDLYTLQTEGELYFRDAYAVSPTDSHPNKDFAEKAVKLLSNRIIDIIENNGEETLLTGKN